MIESASARNSDWHPQAIESLVQVVQDLSYARDIDGVQAIVRKAARELTGADGATFVLRDGNYCYYADENAISPLWKGQRFPIETCISGWVMINAQQVLIEDIYADPRIPAAAYRPTFVKSLAMVPIRKNGPIGAIGNYWASHRVATPGEVSILQALADVTSVAIENANLYSSLQEKIKALEVSNGELNRFAWVASHDLKSPLRAVQNLANWAEEEIEGGNGAKSIEHLELLRTRVGRMEKLLDDVLEYAQIDHKLDPYDVREVITGKEMLKDITSLINVPRGFNVSADAAFEKLKVPRMPLQQVLTNLINNAIVHHDKGEGNIGISTAEEEGFYVFSVTDDGPGIDPQYFHKIFEMFQTLQPRDKKEGSGMGLTIVRKILDIYDATITVEPTGGRGAVFRFTWPKKLILKGS